MCEIRMMHPYFVPLFPIFQGLCMLVLLAGYVFLSVVAWLPVYIQGDFSFNAVSVKNIFKEEQYGE